MSDQILRKALTKLATEVPELRKHLVPILKSASSKLEIDQRGWDSFRVIYPDPYGQTYDSYILTQYGNPKTVIALGKVAIKEWAMKNHGSDDYGDLMDYVNAYVKEKSRGRWDYVKWNSKSYPD